MIYFTNFPQPKNLQKRVEKKLATSYPQFLEAWTILFASEPVPYEKRGRIVSNTKWRTPKKPMNQI